MVLIRPGRVEEALLADPWVKTASVVRDWPDRLIVRVEERAPLAWVETSSGWAHHAIDGVVLPSPDTPDDSMAWIQLPDVPLAESESSRRCSWRVGIRRRAATRAAGRDHHPTEGERRVLGRGVGIRSAVGESRGNGRQSPEFDRASRREAAAGLASHHDCTRSSRGDPTMSKTLKVYLSLRSLGFTYPRLTVKPLLQLSISPWRCP